MRSPVRSVALRGTPFRVFAVLSLLTVSGGAAEHAPKLVEARQLAPLAAGLTLPVRLPHPLHAGSTEAGTEVVCLTTQRVPVSQTEFLPAGVEVVGTVTASTAQPAALSLRFTALRWHKQTVPATLNALALANFSNAEDTYDPVSGGGDRQNNTPANWTTLQIGGDVLTRFNWEGEVDNKVTQRVGFSDFYGVYADPVAGSTGAAAIPHAVGIFSTTAHGLYGFNDAASLRSANGNVTVNSPGKLELRSGDQLLLVVAAP